MTDRDPTDIYGQAEAQQAHSDALVRKRLQELDDVRAVMATPEGRRFTWRMLSIAGVFQVSYTGNPSDSVFNDGRRAAGNVLMNDIFEGCPDQFYRMQQEQRPKDDN